MKARGPRSAPVSRSIMTRTPMTISRAAIVMPGTGERGPAGRFGARTARPVAVLVAAPGGPAGMSSHSNR